MFFNLFDYATALQLKKFCQTHRVTMKLAVILKSTYLILHQNLLYHSDHTGGYHIIQVAIQRKGIDKSFRTKENLIDLAANGIPLMEF